MKTIFKHFAWAAIFFPILTATANFRSQIVVPGSQLAKELNFDIAIQDQAENRIENEITGRNAEKDKPVTIRVTFRIISSEKLDGLHSLTLTVGKEMGRVMFVPLEMKSKFDRSGALVSTFFILQEGLLGDASLNLRCLDGGSSEIQYVIPLIDYLETP